MTLELTDEQRGLREEIRELARERLAPIAAAGEPGRVNRPLVRAMGDEGVLPRVFPAGAGGAAGDEVSALHLCLLREALAAESPEAETALAMQGLCGTPMVLAGTEEQVRRWVPSLARGEAVGAFALTEPEHGTDAAALELRADRDGDGFRLTGV